MRVVGRHRLEDFFATCGEARARLLAWLAEAGDAAWKNPHELKSRFPSASLLKNGRVVFNIGGNRFRLDVKINYQQQIILIVRVGTHEEYETWEF